MREKQPDCEWKDSCDCVLIKTITCENCRFYYFIDSGYGWCKALPAFEEMAWCRDVCGLFKRPKPKEAQP